MLTLRRYQLLLQTDSFSVHPKLTFRLRAARVLRVLQLAERQRLTHHVLMTAERLTLETRASIASWRRPGPQQAAAPAPLFDDDLDAVAERLHAVARAARVYPTCTEAEVIDLAAAWGVATTGQ